MSGPRALKFAEFERRAQDVYEAIPEHYKEGVDGLVVSREAHAHPELPDIWTMGECLTEDWPSEWHGPETTRSVVVLYWGSFRSLAAQDEEFDWEEEIWETLTHELRHHLESLASEDQLEGVDYALDEGFKRADGLEFDPWYYQQGEPDGPGVYRVESQVYLELEWSGEAFDAARRIDFEWEGARWTIDRPEALGDVHFVWVENLGIELVLVRRRSWWQDVRRLFGSPPPVVLESEATARPAG